MSDMTVLTKYKVKKKETVKCQYFTWEQIKLWKMKQKIVSIYIEVRTMSRIGES